MSKTKAPRLLVRAGHWPSCINPNVIEDGIDGFQKLKALVEEHGTAEHVAALENLRALSVFAAAIAVEGELEDERKSAAVRGNASKVDHAEIVATYNDQVALLGKRRGATQNTAIKLKVNEATVRRAIKLKT